MLTCPKCEARVGPGTLVRGIVECPRCHSELAGTRMTEWITGLSLVGTQFLLSWLVGDRNFHLWALPPALAVAAVTRSTFGRLRLRPNILTVLSLR